MSTLKQTTKMPDSGRVFAMYEDGAGNLHAEKFDVFNDKVKFFPDRMQGNKADVAQWLSDMGAVYVTGISESKDEN